MHTAANSHGNPPFIPQPLSLQITPLGAQKLAATEFKYVLQSSKVHDFSSAKVHLSTAWK